MPNYYGDWQHAHRRRHVEDEEDRRFDPDNDEEEEDQADSRRSKICNRLDETLTDDMALRAFRSRFDRKPRDGNELELFRGELIADAYNAGYKKWTNDFIDST